MPRSAIFFIVALFFMSACAGESYRAESIYVQDVPWSKSGGETIVQPGLNYLSDLQAEFVLNGWGPLEKDRSNGEAEAGDGSPLSIGGKRYEKGLGMHPEQLARSWAEVQYGLSGSCDIFSAEVGLDDSIDVQSRYGSVFFQAFGDDKLLWQSERLTGADGPVSVEVGLSGVERLKLVVTNAGDNNYYDHADWADAKIICSNEATPEQFPVVVGYQADNSDFINPERGFHLNVDITSATDLTYIRDEGYSLARTYVRLDDYRDKPLDDAFLSNLRHGLDAARRAGIKIIPRFSYNFPTGGDDGDYQGAPEAPIELALEHIRQLGSMYQDYGDVIAAHPAGFVGAWGEWHSSDPATALDSPENKAKIIDALLDALPSTVSLQLRYPGDLLDRYPEVLSTGQAFSGSDQARVGHHNDCFLANEHDAGTYLPEEQAGAYKRYLDDLTRFTPMGGETCEVSVVRQRTDCETALKEIARFRWDYLNIQFYAATIERWKQESCFGEISKRLGYRYRLLETKASASELSRGDTLSLELALRNEGFGKLYNPRPTEIVFVRRGGGAHTVTLDGDSRSLLPAPGQTASLSAEVRLPGELTSGTYDLYLNLPDGNPGLRDRPEYSIRLANRDVWQPESGFNALNLSVQLR